MKKLILLIPLALFLITGTILPASANHHEMEFKKVNFTDTQKQELKNLHKKVADDKKNLIQKYAEFGAISQEDADKMISHFEKRLKSLEEHNYQFPVHKHGKHMPQR
ncbi:YckD family protein [Bacillus massiliglaciei]|uniref:YckD family protein n=1 Tax=Bacillus massiliglaciei TaxID=1816693 RepID=UPI0018FE6A8D|nr:YckD family protein [Bacillus massiliglaciei]